MSLESARKLYVDMLQDSSLAEHVGSLGAKACDYLKEQGYDFTHAEWEQMMEEIDQIRAGEESGEISDQELESVAGGLSHWYFSLASETRSRLVQSAAEPPVIQPMYGMPLPPSN